MRKQGLARERVIKDRFPIPDLSWDEFICDTTKVEIEPQMVAYNLLALLAIIHKSNPFDMKKLCAKERRD
jgi:hypothetical protein